MINCPNCGIKMYIRAGRYIVDESEKKEIDEGKAVAVERGCLADEWDQPFECPNCFAVLNVENGKFVMIKEPPKCPKCGSDNLAMVSYTGGLNEKLLKKLKDYAKNKRSVFLSDKPYKSNAPDYHCKKCGYEFVKAKEIVDT
jgi:predicted nucleic-acid-binding Zn-ribbon protein